MGRSLVWFVTGSNYWPSPVEESYFEGLSPNGECQCALYRGLRLHSHDQVVGALRKLEGADANQRPSLALVNTVLYAMDPADEGSERNLSTRIIALETVGRILDAGITAAMRLPADQDDLDLEFMRRMTRRMGATIAYVDANRNGSTSKMGGEPMLLRYVERCLRGELLEQR